MEPRPSDTRMRGVVALIGIGLFSALLLVGCSDGVEESASSSSGTGTLRLLDAPQVDADVLPSIDGEMMETVQPETARSLGSAGDAAYWVALTEEDTLCLITTFPDADAEQFASACGEAGDFPDTGTYLGSGVPSEEDGWLSSEVYLLPDDVDAEPLEEHLAKYRMPVDVPEGLTSERAALQEEVNIFAVGPGAYKLPEIELERTSGGTFTFRTLA